MLSDQKLNQIHKKTLKVLSEVGVKFKDDFALEQLKRSGCDVDTGDGIVYFPPSLIEKSVSSSPSEFEIRGRMEKDNIKVGGSKPVFQNNTGLYLKDLKSGEIVKGNLEDARNYIKLLDSLENIDIVVPPPGMVKNKDPDVQYEWLTATAMRNSTKVIAGGNFGDSAEWLVELADVTKQDLYGQLNPTSPLCFSEKQITGTRKYVKSGHPTSITCSPMIGASSPATLAGSLVLQNAEHLAGLTLIQTLQSGTRVTLATYPHVMDMRNAYAQIGGIEVGLFGVAFVELASLYEIPSHTQFPWSDSKKVDVQSGYEKGMQMALCAHAGADIMSNGGGLEGEKHWSPVQLVIDNEINGMALRLLEGVKVNSNTLAFDTIQSVGHLPGNFIKENHTLEHWKEEQYLAEIADRTSREMNSKNAAKDAKMAAREKAAALIDSHEPQSLSCKEEKQLQEILGEAEKAKL